MSLNRNCVHAVFILLAACGTSQQRDIAVEPETADRSNYYMGKDAVYASLILDAGGSWIFATVTESNLRPEKGHLVRLNDLAPAFDTRVAECVPQAYPTDHKCNPTHVFRNKDVGVLGKIISGGIAAGTAGKVTDISRTYKTSFNETAFNQAVDEALVNSGLDRERQNFLESLQAYAMLLQTNRATLDESMRRTEAEYLDTNAVLLDIQPRLSGLTEYYTGDLNFRELIELVPRSTGTSGGTSVTAKKLLPCDARLCARKANSAVESMRAENEKSKTQLLTNVGYVYDVRCEKTSHAGYLLRLDCPGEITRSPTDAVLLPLSLNILARDFDNLYPDIVLRNDDLDVTINSGEVSFSNLTSLYLSITAQTVYYNSKVRTNATAINLAPGATVKRDMREFVSPAIDIESSYIQMTPDKATSSTFEFGFAVKYSGASDAAETTLYDKREFNVGCVIDNRMRPGSCNESPIEVMRADKSLPVPF